MSIPRTSSCLLLLLGFADAASGQRSTRHSFDETTGRFGTAVRHSVPSVTPVAPFGQTIGYTALGGGLPVAPGHSLVELGQATVDLVADGNTLVPILTLTAEELDGIDTLVVGLTSVERVFAEPDVDVVEAFVLGGGKLVFLGENNAFFHPSNVAVGGRFGIVYPTVDPVQDVLTDVVDHPLTSGPFGRVQAVDGTTNGVLGFGSMLPGPFGNGLVRFTDGKSVVVLIEPNALGPGSGVVIAFSDITIFTQDYARADNRALWRNSFVYGGLYALDFETQDDFVTALVNGQSLSTPPEFGLLLALAGSGANLGAAVFDSDPFGPNSPCQDLDLLVGLGKLVILQNSQAPAQSVPGFFDRPNDDQDGGFLTFLFPESVQALSLVLVDIDAGSAQASSVTLRDAAGRTRVFSVPPSWTEDLLVNGPPAWRTLDLDDLEPQVGFASTVTASGAPSFDIRNVLQIDVRLGSSGAVDDLRFVRFCGPH